MSNAAIDVNSKQTITARLNTDGLTITRLIADSASRLETTEITSGSVIPKNFSATDDNGRNAWFAVSEDNPTQLVALQCNSLGQLLIKVI